MLPRVICISGLLQGQEFVLGESGLSFGRSGANEVNLDEVSVSRRHCTIRPTPSGFLISDQGSHNHTWVNGTQTKERILQHGDRICVGSSAFEYVEAGSSPASAASFATMILRRDEAFLLQPQAVLASSPTDKQSLHALTLLLAAIDAMSTGGSLAASASRLLELVCGVFPVAEAGLFLSADAQEASFWWPEPCAPLPNAIRKRVVDDRVSICTSDIVTDGAVDATKSVVQLPSRAVIAVPIVTEDRVIGVLHGAARSAVFTAEQLQLLTSIAAVAASPLAAALRVEKLERENLRLQAQVRADTHLIGASPQMEALHAVIAKVAVSTCTVLIVGESGTGKELVASAIHRNSLRSGGLFLAINCASLTETLLESELFGHEKGAFTGASIQRRGKFEEANGGTLFLDEVGELSLSSQAKLLRVLQERSLMRVGGNQTVQVDVRVIAATNRDLRAMVRSGEFRQDLFFRLNVVAIQTPALRERRGDIAELAEHFVRKHSGSSRRRVTAVSSAALRILARHDWPGNVRELENAIERALVLGSTEMVVPEDLPDSLMESSACQEAATKFHDQVNEAKRRIILEALGNNQGSFTEAARQLGIHPNNLHRLIRSLDVQVPGK